MGRSARASKESYRSSNRSRPASAPPKAMYTPPPVVELDEPGLLTAARALTHRVRVTKLSLERIRPPLPLVVEKRLESYHSAMAFEKLASLQMFTCEELIAHLSKQNRDMVAKVDALAVAKASSDVVPQPTRPELLAILGAGTSGVPVAIDLPLDLTNLDLTFVQFRGAGFAPGTSLMNSWLEGAELSDIDLSRAVLTAANLAFTVGDRPNLSGADGVGVNLAHCRLHDGDISRAKLDGCNLSGSDLRGCRLCHTRLDGATLCFTNLNGCDLTGASLVGCRLAGAIGLPSCATDNLRGAVMTAADGAHARPDGSHAHARARGSGGQAATRPTLLPLPLLPLLCVRAHVVLTRPTSPSLSACACSERHGLARLRRERLRLRRRHPPQECRPRQLAQRPPQRLLVRRCRARRCRLHWSRRRRRELRRCDRREPGLPRKGHRLGVLPDRQHDERRAGLACRL